MAQSRILSSENQSTIIVVTFVLSLLALGFNFYTFERLTEVAQVLAEVDIGMHAANDQALEDANQRISALEAQLAEIKAARPPAE